MLALTRKSGESIVINDNIVIEILAVQDGRVKVGLAAPREMRILRKEVYDAIQETNKESATLKTDKEQEVNVLKQLLKK
ncbi:MAG: carbon storage regulator [Epulopiscium sp. Nele67-Bin001]|nr:MAG: carbon storage regulator [Epulopiscium sp. Nuni2H_MBin001]OON91280.1 MAG: carbon storage regulator [Epulopiscium sp. Nele67-Bin001]